MFTECALFAISTLSRIVQPLKKHVLPQRYLWPRKYYLANQRRTISCLEDRLIFPVSQHSSLIHIVFVCENVNYNNQSGIQIVDYLELSILESENGLEI